MVSDVGSLLWHMCKDIIIRKLGIENTISGRLDLKDHSTAIKSFPVLDASIPRQPHKIDSGHEPNPSGYMNNARGPPVPHEPFNITFDCGRSPSQPDPLPHRVPYFPSMRALKEQVVRRLIFSGTEATDVIRILPGDSVHCR